MHFDKYFDYSLIIKTLYVCNGWFFYILGLTGSFGINKISEDLGSKEGYAVMAISIAIAAIFQTWLKQDEFSFFVKHGNWKKSVIKGKEVWTCPDTDFQLVEGDEVDSSAHGQWFDCFPDKENNYTYYMQLQRHGQVYKQFLWVSADGGRVNIPITEYFEEEGKGMSSYKKNSIEYEMLLKFGTIGSYQKIEDFMMRTKIQLK